MDSRLLTHPILNKFYKSWTSSTRKVFALKSWKSVLRSFNHDIDNLNAHAQVRARAHSQAHAYAQARVHVFIDYYLVSFILKSKPFFYEGIISYQLQSSYHFELYIAAIYFVTLWENTWQS